MDPLLSDPQRTIDLAVRVWLGLAPASEVADWVDARLARVAHADELLLRLAENRNRAPHEVAEDLLSASGVPEGQERTHRMIVALGAAFERAEIAIASASRFLVAELLPRVEAAGLASHAYGIDDGVALAADGIVAPGSAELDFRALVAACACRV